MDDLIEGLIHTMLDDTRPHQVERSSWAEVVGGHGDDNGECPTQSESSRLTANHGGDRGKRHQFKQSHSDYDWQEQDHRRQQVAVDSVCHGEDTDGWHTVGAHHHKTPKKYCKKGGDLKCLLLLDWLLWHCSYPLLAFLLGLLTIMRDFARNAGGTHSMLNKLHKMKELNKSSLLDFESARHNCKMQCTLMATQKVGDEGPKSPNKLVPN
eukprot:Gb_07806 [translate_table: standard]